MMNNHLSVLFVSAILIASIGIAPAFAQATAPIMVSTDKESYSTGETIVISGEVSQRLSGNQVSLQVIAPVREGATVGNVVGIDQISVDEEKKFTTDLVAGGLSWRTTGEYTVKVLYGLNRVAQTTFSYVASDIPPPINGTVIEPTVYTLEIDDLGSFTIGYSITGGSLTSITADGDASSLFVAIDATDDGELTLTLPRDVIDAKMSGCEGDDNDFFVLIDDEEIDEFGETKTSTDRTLTIEFLAGSETIEIIGTCAVPEFGTIAALILAVAIVSIIAVSARSRLSIIPKY